MKKAQKGQMRVTFLKIFLATKLRNYSVLGRKRLIGARPAYISSRMA